MALTIVVTGVVLLRYGRERCLDAVHAMVDRFGGQAPGRRQGGAILRNFAIPKAPGDVLQPFPFLQRLFAFGEDFCNEFDEYHMERKQKRRKDVLCQSPESASPPSRSFTTSAATESTGEGNDTSIEPNTKL